MKSEIGRYSVEARGSDSICESIHSDIKKGAKSWLACLNPHSFVVAQKDQAFSNALQSATYLIPDGIGIVLASMISDRKIRSRVTGADVFFGLHERMNSQGGGKIFFLGSSSHTLRKIEARMSRDFPNLRVVGVYSPPFVSEFSKLDSEKMLQLVNEASPDILWVAMTAPKQEKWIMENLDGIDSCFVGAVGAVFDFYSGEVVRSSHMFMRLGLEWLPRLVREPKRLWRRTFISAPLFIWMIIKTRVKRHKRM